MLSTEEIGLNYIPPVPNIGIGAGALVINESNRVLLVQRPNSLETDRGIWSQPGRRLEFGENPKDAVARHFSRQFGVKPLSLQLLTVHTHISKHPEIDVQWVSICYLCTKFENDGDTEALLSPQWDWFSITNLPVSLTTYTVASLEAFFNRLRS